MSLEEYSEKYMTNYGEKTGKVKSRASKQDKYSECQFSCNICKPGKLFHSRSKAARHMTAIHKINLKVYKEQYGSSLVHKTTHTCYICARVILWDKSVISSHLYDTHDKMPIEEYFNEYIDNFTEENEWLNKKTFQCKECKDNNFSTKSRVELWKHVQDNHKMTEMQYRTIHGSSFGQDFPVSHTCQVCSDKLNWESISLKPHIELKHEMTVQQYVDKYKYSYTRKLTNNQNLSKA